MSSNPTLSYTIAAILSGASTAAAQAAGPTFDARLI
jgi:hypothetical protein